VITVEAATTTVENTAGGRTTRACTPYVAVEMLPGLFATTRHQFARRGRNPFFEFAE